MIKPCTQCNAVKPLAEFKAHKTGKFGRYSACRECESHKRKTPENRTKGLLQQRIWRNKSPENKQKTKDSAKKFRSSEHGKKWIIGDSLKRLYGLSLSEYESMSDRQSGCCGLCGVHQSALSKRLAVDHCHDSGTVRSLLCHHCNTGLGAFKESPSALTRAARYLQSHQIINFSGDEPLLLSI